MSFGLKNRLDVGKMWLTALRMLFCSVHKANIKGLPVSVGWDLSGSWQRETRDCAKAARPQSLQKKSRAVKTAVELQTAQTC